MVSQHPCAGPGRYPVRSQQGLICCVVTRSQQSENGNITCIVTSASQTEIGNITCIIQGSTTWDPRIISQDNKTAPQGNTVKHEHRTL